MGLRVRDDAALEAVLRARLIPDDVASASTRVVRDSHGIAIEPSRVLAPAVNKQLRAIGVETDVALPASPRSKGPASPDRAAPPNGGAEARSKGPASPDRAAPPNGGAEARSKGPASPDRAAPPNGGAEARSVSCWAEAIACVRVATDALPSQVLLVVPRVADLIDLAAELVRLGCDRQELLIAGDVGIIRAVDAPTYTLVRALDRDRGLRAFASIAQGVWCELGYRHALATELRHAPDTLLAIGPDAWQVFPDHGWRPLSDALDLAVTAPPVQLVAGKLADRRRIELRLSTGRREAPSLWVLREAGVAAVDRVLAYLPDEVVARLLFAVTAEDSPTVIVRARTGRHAPPDLALGANVEAYAPLAQMPDLYVPVGARVEPPLRRERLRAIVGIENREVVWLARTAGDKIRVERIADAAFLPLSEWADYVLHANAGALAPWMRSSVFDFAPYVSTGLEWASRPVRDEPEPEPEHEPRSRRKRGRAVEPAPTAPVEPTQVAKTKPSASREPSAVLTGQQVDVDAELAGMEAEFIASDAPGDSPERLDLLERLGRTYARLLRRRDAGLCFARAVWESAPDEARERLDAWLGDELQRTAPAVALSRALVETSPDLDVVRRVALLAARGGSEVASDPYPIQRWLDQHDGELDVRTLWLARLGLSRLAGGDVLGLAHARDRVLARLAGGLPVERELPAFLRLAGRSGALGTSGDHLAAALEELGERLTRTKRKRSPVEAPTAITHAYAGFQLAYGFARIGKPERARELVASSQAALGGSDVVHDYLKAAFSARVDQALAGVAAETALPEQLGRKLAELDRVARYKVDRLREASRILEPHERPDAIGAFSKRQQDARGPEFTAVRALTDVKERARAVTQIIATARQDAVERDRLIDGAFDELLELPESLSVPIFQTAWRLIDECPPERRAALFAEALVIAGHFGRNELVPTLLASLGTAIGTARAGDLDRVLHHGLRALRRIGLRDQMADLLADVEQAQPKTGPDALRGRLALASGLAFLGHIQRALPIFTQARAALAGSMTLSARLELIRALALAYANAPLTDALAGIHELASQLADITDSFGTNSHYCLSVLHFVESLVLGITSDDLVLGETGRRFIEDDEHLIRRRVHRDLQGAS